MSLDEGSEVYERRFINAITTTQRDALSPQDGDIIYNTTTNEFEKREESVWKKMSTKTRDYAPQMGTNPVSATGGSPGTRIDGNTGDSVNIRFVIPDDFDTLVSALLIIIPAGTGSINFDLNATFGGVGEPYNAHDVTMLATEIGDAVLNALYALPCDGALAGLSKGDVGGVKITDGLVVGRQGFDVVALKLVYT